MDKIIVVGGGASGMMAAITAAAQGAAVTLLEKMEKPGKKLLVTGNGRCNLTNLEIDSCCYHGADQAFVAAVLERFSVAECREFFARIGLPTRVREGFVYPYTEQAAAVVEILAAELARLKVKVKYNEMVIGIKPSADGWEVATTTWSYRAERVILACGSMAAPKTGSDDSGYQLAAGLGHQINPVLPALVPLQIAGTVTQPLAGVRSKVSLQLLDGQQSISKYSGELQWTEYGVSGIVVFQVSSAAVRILAAGRKPRIRIDLLPDYSAAEVLAMILKWQQARGGSIAALLTGLFNKKVLAVLLRQLGIKPGEAAAAADIRRIISLAKGLELTVSGTKSYDMAQVCSGGVALAEIDAATMMSRLAEHVYITGELLDVDGICGGYNLQWAWSTGYLAGLAAAGREKGKQ